MEKRKKILIVDDTEINRALLADMLSPLYDTEEASNGLEAVSILRSQYAEFSLVLLDIVMPEMDGFEVLATMNRNGWLKSVPVIMISAEASSTYVDHACDLGATEYITRPFDEKTVQRRVQNIIMLYAKQQILENMVAEQIMEKERVNSQMVEILSNIVEFRNGESGTHVLHIRVISDILLQGLQKTCPQYKLTANRISLISNASAMHDIGKISIDEKILNKPGRLTAEEYEIMKTHTVIGAQILERAPGYTDSELMRTARDICRWHHERYDGRGYPDGLKGDDIPIAAQVVALADVYDALTSTRVYKPAFPHDKAVQMILNSECGAFNPLLLKCLTDNQKALSKELSIHSPRNTTGLEMQRAVSEIMSNGELQISSRTLTLLEQERIKYQFYASMTKEILFEYDRGADLLEFSEWGAKYLGIPELITHPAGSDVCGELGRDSYQDMAHRLEKATADNPEASRTYCLNLRGNPHWFKVVVRTLWDREGQESYSRVIGKLVDIHEDHTKLDKLWEQSMRDPLTGIYNRRATREMAARMLQSGAGDCLMMLIDLDFFKSANDVYGHSFGDRLLRHVAQNIQSSIRKDDIAGRVGGDEFLVFMVCRDDPEQLANRIFQAATAPLDSYTVSLSMGAAVSPRDGAAYDALFHSADVALYEAKRRGKNQHCFFDKSIPDFPSVRTPIDEDGRGR